MISVVVMLLEIVVLVIVLLVIVVLVVMFKLVVLVVMPSLRKVGDCVDLTGPSLRFMILGRDS